MRRIIARLPDGKRKAEEYAAAGLLQVSQIFCHITSLPAISEPYHCLPLIVTFSAQRFT